MKEIKTSIIPISPQFVGAKGDLNKEAICVFAALGFFLDDDTYYRSQYALRPATSYKIDEDGKLVGQGRPWFSWHYEPRELTLRQVTDEFTDLFEHIINEQTGNQSVILPLSGGLDSRTQAGALKRLGKTVHGYSYQFHQGLDETLYAGQVARVCEFPFQAWEVSPGYLWKEIDRLAQLNGCYSESTHPRQMAFIDRYASLGEIFSVGHWGDVLFDDMRVPDDLSFDDQVKVVLKKIVKPGGPELAQALWQAWNLPDSFDDYLQTRIRELMEAIDIPQSANARIRAFKSMYWAPRWTAVNLSIFQSVRPVTAPYFDDRMCKFICTVPEKWLAGRAIQIEYLKRTSPRLARITWQEHRPFNLYTYRWNRAPFNVPYIVWWKLKSAVRNERLVQRNWELQFLGDANDKNLRHYLFDDKEYSEWIPGQVSRDFYESFSQVNPVYFSHPVSMLLTLSLFAKGRASGH